MTRDITVYGAHWCPDCRRSKQFLGEHQIPYDWVDIDEDEEGERFVIEANDGKRRIPTLRFGDGTVLSVPSNAELAAELGLKTTAECEHYDLIIVGGGPAGLTAALYTAREGISTLVVERAALGGQAAATMHLDNVPGFPEGVEGHELADRLRAQAERFGVEILQANEVTAFRSPGPYHCVGTDAGGEYNAMALLLTPGSTYRMLDVPGEQDYLGAGVHFCATCDGPFYEGRDVVVVGGGNSATEEGLFLTRFADSVTLLVRGGELAASAIVAEKAFEHDDVHVRFHTTVEAFEGEDSRLRRVRVRDNRTGETDALDVPGAFIFIGLDPNTGFVAEEGRIRLTDDGFILTGHAMTDAGGVPGAFGDREPALLETSVPGIFSAGDARYSSTKQVASAAGEGAAAALMIREYLRSR